MSEESSVAAQQIWKKKYELGCEWCGQKYPSIATKTNAGYATYGLEFCHIFAGGLGPAHEWNGFILCPHCHTIFDKVLKPKLQTAFTKAITGFGDPPTNPKKPYCVASTYRGCVEALIKRSGAAANELPGVPEGSLIPWSTRTKNNTASHLPCTKPMDNTLLTKEIAEKWLAGECDNGLSSFTKIADDAAEALGTRDGVPCLRGELDLKGLKTLSDVAAKSLAKHHGMLNLSGLSSVSDSVIDALSMHQGTVLWLSGLVPISDSQAKALANHKGKLFLCSLNTLSDVAAEVLAKHDGDLYLNGLEMISDVAAEALAKHKGLLYLGGLTRLSEVSFASLRNHNGEVRVPRDQEVRDLASGFLNPDKMYFK